MWYLKAAESFNHFISFWFFLFCFFFLQMTAEAMLRLASDPVLPFYPLDIALDVQNKLKGNSVNKRLLSSLGPSTSFKIHQCTQSWKDKCLNRTVLLGNWELVKDWYPYLKSWYNKHKDQKSNSKNTKSPKMEALKHRQSEANKQAAEGALAPVWPGPGGVELHQD